MTRIIDRGTTIPTQKTKTFSTSTDNQSAVNIQVFEGERSMTKDNHLLGLFDLKGIPPAPRGVPQIDVMFSIDANGILQVSAEDKGSGKAEKITIEAETGRLSDADIERMIEEAELYAEEDKLARETIDCRNGLESYAYNLKNTLEDDENGKVSAEDKKDLLDSVDDVLDWLEENMMDMPKDECLAKQKEIEAVANPIMRSFYSSGGTEFEEDTDFGDDEL